MTPGRIAARIGLVTAIGLSLLGVGLSAIQGWPTGTLPLIYGPLVVVFSVVGWLIVERRVGNLVGPILLLFGVGLSVYLPLDAYLRQPGPGPGAAAVAVTVQSLDVPSFTMLALALLLFPDGRVPSERWRFAIPLAGVVIAAGVMGVWLEPGPVVLYPVYVSPIGIAGFPGQEVVVLAYAGMLVLFGLATASLVVRWRRGQALERTQIKWIAAAAAVALAAEVLNVATFDAAHPDAPTGLLATVGLTLIPLSIGVAILRYRLYEIDRIISRTIAYAVVVGLLGVVFAVGVIGLQTALASFTSGQAIPVAASTLAVFALFQPVMRRVRRTVDRRFDRARYDAERTAVAFSERLRDEVDLSTVTTDLRSTVSGALAPADLAVWLRSGRAAR